MVYIHELLTLRLSSYEALLAIFYVSFIVLRIENKIFTDMLLKALSKFIRTLNRVGIPLNLFWQFDLTIICNTLKTEKKTRKCASKARYVP